MSTTTRSKPKPKPKPRESGGGEQKKKEKKIDAQTGLECVDADEINCPVWAASGDCQKNRVWMGQNCRLSCDRCHIVRVQNGGDMNRIITQKYRETEPQREKQRRDRETIRVLQGGTPHDEL